MDTNTASAGLGALAQETRLRAFRLLVRSGPEGLAAGNIAQELGTPHNTMSSHLAILQNAGLVKSRRDGRSIVYCVDFKGTKALLAYLMQDCCLGAPEVCEPVLDSVLAGCCETTN